MWICKLDTLSPAECKYWGAPGKEGNDMQCGGNGLFVGCCPYRSFVEDIPLMAQNSTECHCAKCGSDETGFGIHGELCSNCEHDMKLMCMDDL